MHKLPEPAPRRWRVPVFLLLGTALLVGSFTVAALALPSRAADDGAPPPANADQPDLIGRRTVAAGMVDTREGVTTVLPLQPGQVKEVYAKEQQDYDKGAKLYQMDDQHAQFDLNKAENALRAAELQQEQAKQLPEKHRAALAAQQAVIAAKESKRDAAQKDADDAKRLIGKGVSAEKAAAAQKMADAADGEVEAEKKKLRAMELDDPELVVKLAAQDVSAKTTQRDEAKWALEQCTVKAPFKGKVLRMQINVGDLLPNPRQAPLWFCSTEPRIVRAEIEQEFAPKVYVGQPARIKDYADDDAGTWKGKVTSISDWYTHRRSMIQEPLQFNDVRTVEAIVELDPGQKPLKIGQRVRVTLPVAQ